MQQSSSLKSQLTRHWMLGSVCFTLLFTEGITIIFAVIPASFLQTLGYHLSIADIAFTVFLGILGGIFWSGMMYPVLVLLPLVRNKVTGDQE